MGYKLLITEFDVNDHAAPTDVAVRDRMVADYAKAYLDLMLSYPQLATCSPGGCATATAG